MKKILKVFLMLMCLVSLANAGSIKQLVFFGDSLTDDGNLYKLLLKIIPKSPPYYKGRFSNGPTWAEYVGKHYYAKNYIDYKIYAVAGATAVIHAPTDRFLPPTNLDIEVDMYLLKTVFQNKSQILYSIWIGSNDYLYDTLPDPDDITSRVVDKIESSIIKLINHGAKSFLIFNLPDLAQTPFAQKIDYKDRLHLLSLLHNQKLKDRMAMLERRFPNIKFIFIDVYSIFVEFLSNPEKYNKLFHVHITNTTDACWKGGFLFKPMETEEELTKELTAALQKQGLTRHFDVKGTINYILNTPSVVHAYRMGKFFEYGIKPCENASEYIFWDQMHPTEVVSNVLSQIVLKILEKEVPIGV